jgi:aspartyl-tRNA(Asn)/glutamyl-tRNA(Gln) amidotransferase subunit C
VAVSREDVMYIARLAHLDLTPEEIERYTPQLNHVLAHVAELAEVDVGDVAPVGGVSEWDAPLRDDEVTPADLAFSAHMLSEYVAAGFFTLPKLPAHGGESS